MPKHTVAAADEGLPNPDAELLDIAARFSSTLAVVKSMEGTDLVELDAFEEIVLTASRLLRKIALTPATTLTGLKAKAKALIWACECEDLEVTGKFDAEIMPASVARDLLAISDIGATNA